MNRTFNSFLGTGWAFPPAFDAGSGEVELVSDVQDINESLNILLSTSLGERVMQPRYGCDLHDYLFESLNSSMIGFIRDRVENSLIVYEPRIKVERIDVSEGGSLDLLEGKFIISIDYSIPGVNSRFNYVYDYYLNEAIRAI